MRGHIRFFIMFGAVVAFAALTVFVISQFSDAISFTEDGPRLVTMISLGLLIGSSVLLGERIGLGEALRNILIWAGIGLVVLLGYSYRDELQGVWNRLSGEISPGTVTTGDRSLSVRAGRNDQFYIDVTFNDATATLLIDTGASSTVISQSLARRAGIDPATLNYTITLSTANGRIQAAPARIGQVIIGPRTLKNVRVLVSSVKDDRTSVLGIETLRLFRSYSVEGNTFTLRW